MYYASMTDNASITTAMQVRIARTVSCLSVVWIFGGCAEPAGPPRGEESAAVVQRVEPLAVRPLAAPALRIMPLGDSITFGVGSSTFSSYRAALWNRLAGQSVNFVGTQQSGQLPDVDNEGHSGWLISDIATIATQSVSFYRPNLVTLHIGTNDMNRNVDVANAPARLGALIDQILAAGPDATVLVATLVPANDAAVQARIDAYNRQIPGVVAQRRNAGKHVQMVDMRAVTTADLSDTLHPNDGGYGKMADAFFTGIQAVLGQGWIATPVAGGAGPCIDTPGGWIDRGQIAGGTGAGTAGSVRFADINGDGRDDYLVVGDNGALHAWINNGGDTAAGSGWIDRGQIAAGTGAPPSQLRLAEVTCDRRADYLVVTGTNGAIQTWVNNGGDVPGGGGWISRGQTAGGAGPSAQIRFADINGDGRADYLVLADNGAIHAWINNGGDR